MKSSPLFASSQRGLSIVELLIALAISSFLILGITQIYIDNKRNYNFQQNQANLQENQRFLVMLLDGYLNRAGYIRSPVPLKEEVFAEASGTSDCPGFLAGENVIPTNDGNGLCIRYFPFSEDELDCTGSNPPAFNDSEAYNEGGAPIVMVLRHVPANDLQGVLQCKVGTRTADLVTGLADFRFAIMSNGTQVRYEALTASEFHLRSSDESLALDTWKLGASPAAIARLDAGDKKQLFQMTTNTVALRNLTP